MAEMKYLNTRVQLKYDSLQNWTTKNPALLQGELAIAYLGDSHTTTTPDNGTHPVVFKVGPGNFNSLPFASALAADVYAWAKKEYLELADLPDIPVVDEETGKFVTDVEWDAVNNKIIIHRANVVAADIADAPWLLPANESKDFGKVSGNTGSIEADTVHDEVKITGDGVISTSASGDTLTISADLSNYATKFELVNTVTTVAEGNGIEVTSNGEANPTYTISHADTSEVNNVSQDAANGDGNAYISSMTFDDFGHVTSVSTSKVTTTSVSADENSPIRVNQDPEAGMRPAPSYIISMDVDQAKTALGLGSAAYTDAGSYKTKQTAVTDPTADGSATAFIDTISQNANGEIVVTKKNITAADLGLSSAMHFVGAHSEAPDSAKAGDVYLNTATKKEYVYDTTNGWVELGDEGSYALKSVSVTAGDGLTGGGSLEANRTISLSEATKASLAKADSALQEHQDISGKADKVSGAVDGNFAGLDANGNLTNSGKKASDFATAAQGAKADTAVQPAALNNYYNKNEADTKFLEESEVKAVKVDNATHADAASKVDNKLSVTANDTTTEFDGSVAQSLNLDSIYKKRQEPVNLLLTPETQVLPGFETIEKGYTQTLTSVRQDENGKITLEVSKIGYGDGEFTVSGTGALTGSGSMTANQYTNSSATLDVVEKGITTAKIADNAVGADQTKALKTYTGSDAEVWVFYCGTASELV